jgi:hypothetical protein
MNNTTNTYTFLGTRWVPGYNDFDFDDFTIIATNETEAWDILWKLSGRFTWGEVNLVYINGELVERENC